MKTGAQRGYTLVEIMMALAVCAVLVAATAGASRWVSNRIHVAQTLNDASDIEEAMTQVFGNNMGYADLTPALLTHSSVIPDHLIHHGQVVDVWGGVLAFGAAADNPFSLSITWPAVPARACSPLVTGLAGRFETVRINGLEVKATNTPVAMESLTTACHGSISAAIEVTTKPTVNAISSSVTVVGDPNAHVGMVNENPNPPVLIYPLGVAPPPPPTLPPTHL